MQDTFAITIIFIICSAFIAAFIKGRSKDKCLVEFSGDRVTLEQTSGKTIWGKLIVETTGLEMIYPKAHKDQDGHDETSYILYKGEYPTIQAIIRYHEDLDEKRRLKRDNELKKTYHPNFYRRAKRKMLNLFKTVRDSMMDVVNMVIDLAKKRTPAGALMTSQDKYVSQVKQEMIGFVGTSYEPLLERHIGAKVVLEVNKNGKKYEFVGILKDYTADYIELMDVNYRLSQESPPKKADVVVPRQYTFVRHLGE
ncbi:MAG: hypothetical protein ABIJ41_08025 [Candidatus Omnitrophota bacterium]